MDDDRSGPPGRQRGRVIGLYLTAAWLLFGAAYTNADRTPPLYDYIFNVPLAAWVAAVAWFQINQWRRTREARDARKDRP